MAYFDWRRKLRNKPLSNADGAAESREHEELARIKIRITDICGKAECDGSGNISVPEGNMLLHMVMRYLAPRYTPDEMLDIAAEEKKLPRETLAQALGRFGEINADRIKTDFILNLFEVQDTPKSELNALAEQFENIKRNHSDAEMIAALSAEEFYYTAALRRMCKPIDQASRKK